MHVNSMMCTPVYVDQGEKVVVVMSKTKIDRREVVLISKTGTAREKGEEKICDYK